MPYIIEHHALDKGYIVRNTQTGAVHATHATHENAKKQVRLLYGLENGMKLRSSKHKHSKY